MGVQVPLGHTLTYMLTVMHVVVRRPKRGTPVIDGHGLVSIWQEHDIPRASSASAPVSADHESDNAVTWHS
jgi:hypothetical protein